LLVTTLAIYLIVSPLWAGNFSRLTNIIVNYAEIIDLY
jgi:hypothetical protein